MLLTQWLGIFLLASVLWIMLEVGKAQKYIHYIGSEYLILIADGEEQKLTFAQQYENGDISLIEFEQQRNSIDKQIYLHIEKRIEAILNSSKIGRFL